MKIGFKIKIGLLAVFVLSLVAMANAQTPLSFSKAFAPGTIGPGSTATLTFTITNNLSTSPADDVAFTDVLPTGVTIATPASALSSCGGIVSAPDGGGTISLSGGRLGANESCTVTVNVTSNSTGTHNNVSGVVTSSVGSSSAASADLIVDADLPGLSKSFSPSTITPGGTSTMIYTIDNIANGSSAFGVNFLDLLPEGMAIASPANASNNCSGTVSAGKTDGGAGSGSFVSFNVGLLPAGGSCTVEVDITTDGPGTFVSTSQNLLSGIGSPQTPSGFATAVLSVPREFLAKSFTDDPVAPGGTVTLEFTMSNTDRLNDATNIAFTDTLDNTLSGLVRTGPPANECGGTVSGTNIISFTGGTLGTTAADSVCTFSVSLDVPSGAASGTYTNTTSAVTYDAGSNSVVGNTATDDLVVEPAPLLTKAFTNDPASAGGTVDLQFTITNTSSSFSATDITFQDELPIVLPDSVDGTLSSTCGGAITFTALVDSPPPASTSPATLTLTGGSIGTGGSCTIDITLKVASDAANDTYPNTTSAIFATVNGSTFEGDPASDDLVIISVPDLSKSFIDDPAAPGGQVTVEYTLTHGQNAPGDATNIAFTDNLDAALTNLAATGLPANECGGTVSGTGVLSFSGGSLTPGSSCSFTVTLQVPAAAPSGIFTSTTSNITADVNSVSITGADATDDLQVAALQLTKEFTDDPVDPGDPVTLKFTLTNISGAPDATDITFKDDLDEVLNNLTIVTPLSTGDCDGVLAATNGNTFLAYSGGTLTGGSSCTFDVTLNVPAGATPDTYVNTTHDFAAKFGGPFVGLPNASDLLVVAAPATIALSKSFDGDPAPSPGDTLSLTFTMGYDGQTAASGINFTDNLGDAGGTLSGLEAIPPLSTGTCNGTLTGTTTLSYSGGSLAPGGLCSFSVDVKVPLSAPDTTVTNTTSAIAATVGTQGITGDPASDDLTIVIIGSSEGEDSGRATEETLVTDRDSFLRPGNQNRNEGGNPLLHLSGLRRLVVGFDLSGVDTSAVATASLVLTINDDNPPGQWGANGRKVRAPQTPQWSGLESG